ncbi:MAG: D-glycero-beta-D-manno-heptose-7-phosphate kinase [Ignavibacteria bacterium]|jgi:rfaE bifunctional protein kinase chain/domain|nr:D-glycero-beta-D-manno-heptose-7-phosphate kinase [Ignavibacteria bacterium]
MLKLEQTKVKQILANINKQKVAVIGDVMLDRYFWGNVSRVSPEAPVPVVDVEKESFHLGGAANVAQNLSSLGITPILFGVLGEDEPAKIFIERCKANGISPTGLLKDKNRITTVKTRVIGNNQQIVRIDSEVRREISEEEIKTILKRIKNIRNLEGIIFEDYDKGTINESLITKIVEFSNEKRIPIFVDPKFDNFLKYKDVTLFKPNRRETEEGLGINLDSYEKIQEAGKTLIDKLNAKNVLITLGADGMVLFEENGDSFSIPTVARKIADVSGAGDTAIATFATMLIAGASYKEAAILANLASGNVCEKPGIVAIKTPELLEAIE